jgi:hypothetical protein
MIKSRRLRWGGYVAQLKQMRKCTKFWSGNLKRRNYLEDIDIEGKIIFKWLLRKQCGLDASGSG